MSSETKDDDVYDPIYTKIFKDTYERNLSKIFETFQDVDGSLDIEKNELLDRTTKY